MVTLQSQLQSSSIPINPNDLIALRQAVGWLPFSRESAQRSLQHTLYSQAFFTAGEYVAYGRVLGDGVLFFYIQDLIVLPEFQGKGLGSTILRQLLAWIENQAAPNAFVGLFATAGNEAFYQRFGFIAQPDCDHGAGMMKRLF